MILKWIQWNKDKNIVVWILTSKYPLGLWINGHASNIANKLRQEFRTSVLRIWYVNFHLSIK